jgi:hypothetical protein
MLALDALRIAEAGCFDKINFVRGSGEKALCAALST